MSDVIGDSSNINLMNYRWVSLTAGIGIATALFLRAAKTDGMNVMRGQKAFTNTASLSPGLARKITAQDLPQPRTLATSRSIIMMIGAGFGGAKWPESAIPKAPPGFKVDIFVASGLRNRGKSAGLRTVIFSSRILAAERFESSAASQPKARRRNPRCTPVSPGPSE